MTGTDKNQTLRRALFAVAILAQAGLLGWMVAGRLQLLASGKSAILQCVPVDPRSFLSGDYVALNFAISRLEKEEMKRVNVFNEAFKERETIYVALRAGPPDPGRGIPAISKISLVHRPVAIAHDAAKLKSAYGDLIIRGTVTLAYNNVEGGQSPNDGELRVRYGVEEYFVPQNEGLKIQNEMAQTTVEVALAESGESAIRKLFIGGNEVKFY